MSSLPALMVVFSWETRLLTYILGPELFVSVPCAMTEEGTLDLAMQNTDMCQIYGYEAVDIPCGDTLDFLYPFVDREGSISLHPAAGHSYFWRRPVHDHQVGVGIHDAHDWRPILLHHPTRQHHDHPRFLWPHMAHEGCSLPVDFATLHPTGCYYAAYRANAQVAWFPASARWHVFMYAGFKRIAPDQDTGMDLNEPWITALELFNVRKCS